VDRALAEFVRARAGFRCEYCLVPQEFEMWSMEIDHVIAQSHGGQTTADNLALACFFCNSFKGPNLAGIDSVTGRAVLLFHPRRQQWRRHFRYDGPILIGRSAAARATIATLRMNVLDRIGQRRRLISEGVFRTT
jgi:hypothetical protein